MSHPSSIEKSSRSSNDENNDDDDAKDESESWKDSDFLTFDDHSASDNDHANDDHDKNDDDDEETSNPNDSNAHSKTSSRYRNNRHTSQPQPRQSSLTSVNDLPPWMDRPHSVKYHRSVPKLVLLHDEIVDFARLMAPQPEELQMRQELVGKVTKLIKETFVEYAKCQVQVFGSQATELFLPTSDIDFVVHLEESTTTATETNHEKRDRENDKHKKQDPPSVAQDRNTHTSMTEREKDQKEMDEYNICKELKLSPLGQLGEALRHHPDWRDELSYLEVVENTRVPIVKFTHAPTNINIDVCFNQDAGPLSADLMKRLLDAMPPLKPLTFVMKYFLAARGLNEPYTGGCGSFLLQLMIVSFLQHRERHSIQHNHNQRYDGGTANTMNLGSMLLEFLELYGMDFNYCTTGISIRSDGFYFSKGAKGKKEHFYNPTRPFSLAMENPFDITADVGKTSYRMQLIAKSFETAMRVLLSHTAEPVVYTESILASILPPTEEMYQRASVICQRGEGQGQGRYHDARNENGRRGGDPRERKRKAASDSGCSMSESEDSDAKHRRRYKR